ncbi:hypothetical protein M409DRAFT_60389 [Zasmidium cellare ATCC 36951]|uniref:Uncharacterized protein n=1 Tax=Zasmidium cellare ATCC 36951 TaxID=1080233 RepID=A0A6A6C143_ZASCE|nr:uncharacterized protein M409DRAFT_60389 [Zasmidium cellare ATCC 36951]KAF2159988.1 hypothetical protein M409DRAFT_60389 [Zasmidium cellare ATCC 36951]
MASLRSIGLDRSKPVHGHPIDLSCFLGDHTCPINFLAQKCLIGAWASFLNLGRKGDAEYLRQLGISIFGEAVFTTSVSQALLVCQAPAGAADGFGRIEVSSMMGLHIADDREMGKTSLVGAWTCFYQQLKQEGNAETVEKLGFEVYGEEAWEAALKKALYPGGDQDQPDERIDLNATKVNVGTESSFRVNPNSGNVGQVRAQSWAFEVFDDEDEDNTTTPNVTIKNPSAAAPNPDYGSYCKRCGTSKANGTNEEGLGEEKIKVGKVQDGGDVGETSQGRNAVGEDKKATVPTGRICDRCGVEDGVGGKFWGFHVLDPGHA